MPVGRQVKNRSIMYQLRDLLFYWFFTTTFIIVSSSKCKEMTTCKIKVERVSSSPKGHLYEVPHWDKRTRSLYFADVPDSILLRYDYDEDRVYSATIDNAPPLLFILPIKCTKDQFLVGMERKAVIVRWNGRSPKAEVIRTVFEVDCGTTNSINDIKTDRFGRFYGGTRLEEGCDSNATANGGFYMYEKGKCLKKLLNNIALSNGLMWVRNKFYYIDTCAYDLKEFDYDPQTGNICKNSESYQWFIYNFL